MQIPLFVKIEKKRVFKVKNLIMVHKFNKILGNMQKIVAEWDKICYNGYMITWHVVAHCFQLERIL